MNTDLWDANAQALIAFALVMIALLLAYVVFYKIAPPKKSSTSSRGK